MPDPKTVLRHLFGPHTRAIAPRCGAIGPSIIIEPAFIAFFVASTQRTPCFSHFTRAMACCTQMSTARQRHGVAPCICRRYARHSTKERRYRTLHHFRSRCFRDFAAFFRESPRSLAFLRAKCQDMLRMGNGVTCSSAAPHGWDQYAWDGTLVHQYSTLHHFRITCFCYLALSRDPPCLKPGEA